MPFLDRNRIGALAKAHRSLIAWGRLVICLGLLTGLGASVWYVAAAVDGLPDEAAVRGAGSMDRATTIVDVKGRHAFTIFTEQRLQVPLSRVSPNVIRAMIAIEDQRFYRHGGIDVIRVAGAAVNNVVKWRAEQGASTITQQAARLTFLKPNKTIRRKVQEVILAMRLERTFTKDQILELYLSWARTDTRSGIPSRHSGGRRGCHVAVGQYCDVGQEEARLLGASARRGSRCR